MMVVYKRCAGLDVHKKTVVACRITPDEVGGWQQDIRAFGTMTSEGGRESSDHINFLPRASRQE
jgi:hypothetical protein